MKSRGVDSAAASSAANQAGDLALHVGRPVAPGNVRLQARAGPPQRRADARVGHQRGSRSPSFKARASSKSSGRSFDFAKHGQSGQEISSALPHIAGIADDICIIRSMVTEAINHDPAHTFMNTGTTISGRPSMGSWLTYGLGSEADDLPGFVVLTSFAGRSPQPISNRMWHSGFLPGRFQGIQLQFHRLGRRISRSARPASRCRQQREVIDAVRLLSNRLEEQARRRPGNRNAHRPIRDGLPHADQRAELMDFRDESQATLDLYGAKPGDGSFASNCLLARRMAERGVRFIQLYHRDWDHHNDLKKFVGICAGACDRALGCPGAGSQAARHARRNARRLGRRVRPHADGPGRQRRASSAATIT